MTDPKTSSREAPIILAGLSGSEFLAFAAALGVLRLLSPGARLSWGVERGVWRPALLAPGAATPAEVVALVWEAAAPNRTGSPAGDDKEMKRRAAAAKRELGDAERAWKARLRGVRGQQKEAMLSEREAALEPMRERLRAADRDRLVAREGSAPAPHLALEKDVVQATGERFHRFARAIVGASSPSDRAPADFMAGFGSEACVTRQGKLRTTELNNLRASSRQYFLDALGTLITATERAHIEEALFGDWGYRDDPPRLAWEAADDRNYALRADDPSESGADAVKTVRGANRLAMEAIPLFPCQPSENGRLATTGFSKQGEDLVLTWPLWSAPLDVDEVRSILAYPCLCQESPDPAECGGRGISAVFRLRQIVRGEPPAERYAYSPSACLFDTR